MVRGARGPTRCATRLFNLCFHRLSLGLFGVSPRRLRLPFELILATESLQLLLLLLQRGLLAFECGLFLATLGGFGLQLGLELG